MTEVEVNKFLLANLAKNEDAKSNAKQKNVLVSEDELDAMQEAQSLCAILKMREELAKSRANFQFVS